MNNWKQTSFGTHQPNDEVAEYKYQGEVLFTANRKKINERNTKYTIKWVENKLIHQLKTGDCQFEWEIEVTASKGAPAYPVDLTIYKAGTENNEWVFKATYSPYWLESDGPTSMYNDLNKVRKLNEPENI
jgi:hypothetical protein